MSDDLGLQRLNALDENRAREELTRCCGASKWVSHLLETRPFASSEALLEASDAAFDTLLDADWLEAFAHHPQIGDLDSLRLKFAATRDWTGEEQAGASTASEAVLRELAGANREYKAKFGFIFIICATGKSAGEMLEALKTRQNHLPEIEIREAATQQKRITRLRLERLLRS